MSTDVRLTLIVFAYSVVFMILALMNAPSPEERRLFSDQAGHVMAAMSVWNDFDLKYTLDDLKHFREQYPTETGPTGLFLKEGHGGDFYYAKPFLYASFAAPFYAIYGVDGFIILNALCFFVLALMATYAIQKHFPHENNWIAVAIVMFYMVFSPHTAWISVPHPDLFIASLLVTSGYMLLGSNKFLLNLIGALVLGFAIYEKPTFLVAAPFLLFAAAKMEWKDRVKLLAMIAVGWFMPTIINITQDGNIFSYQGSRFYVPSSTPFPLEDGWVAPSSSLTEHIFKATSVMQSLLGNLYLLPTKFHDFVLGRQTSIVLYYPLAAALLVWLMCAGNKRTWLIVLGFFSYLSLYWIVFPTNGYGGSGSYGSRYLMQILPLLSLALLVSEPLSAKLKQSNLKKISVTLIAVGIVLSVFTQYKVLPPRADIVQNSGQYLSEYPSLLLSIEGSLLPTIEPMMRQGFSDFSHSGRDRLYRVGFASDLDFRAVELNSNSQMASAVLYQYGDRETPPPVTVVSQVKTSMEVLKGGDVLWRGQLEPSLPLRVSIDESEFSPSYYDILTKREFRWMDLDFRFYDTNVSIEYPAKYAGISLGTIEENKLFDAYDEEIKPVAFSQAGIDRGFSWSYMEGWGSWTNGDYADLSMRVADDVKELKISFTLNAYTPPEHPEQEIEILINGRHVDNLKFSSNGSVKKHAVRVNESHLRDDGKFTLGFYMHNPVSPSELGRGNDPRRLGVALHNIKIEK